MPNIPLSDRARWVLGRALLLNSLRTHNAPETILTNQIEMLEEALDMVRNYFENLAQLICNIEIESCKQSAPCYFCGHLSHDDTDEEGIPDTKCLKGHPVDHTDMDVRSVQGCVDYDPTGATFPVSQIADDIADAKKKYSPESVRAALATMGEFLYRRNSANITACSHCSTLDPNAPDMFCSRCGRLLTL